MKRSAISHAVHAIVSEWHTLIVNVVKIDKVKKGVGDPYNFEWSGSFFSGFELSVQGIEATISSTGVGSGGKKKFLTTNNLFGLQEDNLKTIIKQEILPFMHKIARETLGI